jgi:Flp pilus assembly pilin Flp
MQYCGSPPPSHSSIHFGGNEMNQILGKLFRDEQGQDIAEYAVMLAVILVIVVGTIRLIGTNANTVFSQVASSVQ